MPDIVLRGFDTILFLIFLETVSQELNNFSNI